MMASSSEEAPLGFSGDVDLRASFKLTGEATTTTSAAAPLPGTTPGSASTSLHGFAVPIAVERLPPPSLQDEGLVGGGVVLTGEGDVGVGAGQSLVNWRAQGSGLWVEERGLDDDVEDGGLYLKLEGACVRIRGCQSSVGSILSEEKGMLLPKCAASMVAHSPPRGCLVGVTGMYPGYFWWAYPELTEVSGTVPKSSSYRTLSEFSVLFQGRF